MAAQDVELIAPLSAAVRAAVADRHVERIVVALGGGADSASLLAAACDGFDGAVTGLFVDHGLEHSAALAEAATAAGEALGIAVEVVSAPVPDGPDLERRARDARYAAIDQALGGNSLALTGHTRDDQAETVLMRLVDGAGSTGLAGIPAMRGHWARPFLGFARADLRRVADGLGLPYLDDPANADVRFTRSRIRSRVVPVVEAQLGDHAREGLARSAALLALDDTTLEHLASRIPVFVDGQAVEIPVAPLVTEPIAVASRACRRALRAIGDGYPGTSRDTAALLDVAATGTSHSLSGGLVAVRNGPHIRIGPVVVPDPVDLEVGGRSEWGGATYRVHADDTTPVLPGGRFTTLALRAVRGGLTLRGARDGDRIDIGTGTTPVAEVLRSHGVAAGMRPVSPVAVIGGKIGAVVGVRTAAWASPSGGSRRVIIEREVGT